MRKDIKNCHHYVLFIKDVLCCVEVCVPADTCMHFLSLSRYSLLLMVM